VTERESLKELFAAYAQTGDVGLRDELVSAHMGLAAYLAKRFANRGQSLDDLTQVAALGLLKAVDRFDPGLEVEFSTYATTTIVGELKRYLRDKGWAVRAPRRMQELYLTLGKVVDPLGQELGRSPTIAELASEVEASEEEVLEALEAGQAYRFASLDAPKAEAEGAEPVVETLGAEDEELDRAEQRATLEPLLDQLPPREREIVKLRFFDGLTQSEIAHRLNLSQMHVSRLLTRSVAQLRALAREQNRPPRSTTTGRRRSRSKSGGRGRGRE
jgi:RNA polymerase sigma-B factor